MPPKGKAVGKPAAPKKMSSLSSFQPTLSFARVPSSSASSASPAAPSSSTTSTASRRDGSSAPAGHAAVDRSMPPPPVPARRVSGGGSGEGWSSSSATSKTTGSRGKGKEKARVMDDKDEDEDCVEVISISSDEDEVVAPVAPRKRRRSGAGQLSKDKGEPAAMWSDVYGPETDAELAPGKARVTKVREWLYEAVHGVPPSATHSPTQAMRDRSRKYKRILFIAGPAGIGKATTVRLLARDLGLELVEWTEGVEERHLGGGFENESSIAKLSSFLSRNAYPALHLGASSSKKKTHPRALLMTSLPNIGHLATRETFHKTLLDFCKNFSHASCPLIIVHSESGSGGRAEESWMGRDRGGYEGPLEVLGREVKDGPWCTEIDFLSLAPTFMIKALNRVLGLAISDPDKRPSPGAVQLIAHSSNGDLRSAINSLQLLSSGTVLKKKKRKSGDLRESKASGRGSRGGRGAKIDVSDDIRAALDAVTRREQSLNLFHALGKVLYNKRLDDPGHDNDDQETIAAIRKLSIDDPLPPHLAEFERRKSMVQIETFLPTIPVDASTFALWLHQNTPSFCTDIDQASAIMDDLCGADIMRTDDDIWQSSPQAIAYALHLAVRGCLMDLPSPVPRLNQKVVKPQFFEAYRAERDATSLLDVAAGYLTKKAVAASKAYANGETLDEGSPWGGMASKIVLATETVPATVKIQALSRQPLLPISVQPLALAPYSMAHSLGGGGNELADSASRDGEGESFDAQVAGEDGMGVVPDAHVWDVDDGGAKAGDEAEELGWLEDDDVEDFSDDN